MHPKPGLNSWQSWSQPHNPISYFSPQNLGYSVLAAPRAVHGRKVHFLCISTVLPIGSGTQWVQKFNIFCLQYFPGPHRARQGYRNIYRTFIGIFSQHSGSCWGHWFGGKREISFPQFTTSFSRHISLTIRLNSINLFPQ